MIIKNISSVLTLILMRWRTFWNIGKASSQCWLTFSISSSLANHLLNSLFPVMFLSYRWFFLMFSNKGLHLFEGSLKIGKRSDKKRIMLELHSGLEKSLSLNLPQTFYRWFWKLELNQQMHCFGRIVLMLQCWNSIRVPIKDWWNIWEDNRPRKDVLSCQDTCDWPLSHLDLVIKS